MRRPTVLVAIALVGCTDTPDDRERTTMSSDAPPSASDAPDSSPFRTSDTVYAWTRSDSIYRLGIPLTYENAADDTLYVVNCNGHRPYGIERREAGGEWPPFWLSATNGCLSSPILIAPRTTFHDTADIAIRLANRELPDGAGPAELSGEFRLVWHSLRRNYATEHANFGDTLPDPLERSNAFRLRE